MQCKICFNTYNDTNHKPYLLGCEHTFCGSCLQTRTNCFLCNQIIGQKTYNRQLLNLQQTDKGSKSINYYVKIRFCGNKNTGKTTYIKVLMGKPFTKETKVTIGEQFQFITKKINNRIVRFELNDTSGTQKFKSVASLYYKSADIILLFYNCAEPENTDVMDWYKEIRKNSRQNVKVIVVGNKLDLNRDQSIPAEVEAILKAYNLQHIRISCLQNYNIEKLWLMLQQSADTLSQILQKKEKQKKNSSIISSKPKSLVYEKNKCCK